jgi:hypothetical protein
MRPLCSLRRAPSDPKLLGTALAGDSWQSWRVLLVAAVDEPHARSFSNSPAASVRPASASPSSQPSSVAMAASRARWLCSRFPSLRCASIASRPASAASCSTTPWPASTPRPRLSRGARLAPSGERTNKRRAVIGHLKEHHRMGRNHLAHASGDNAVLAAAGYNFRRLLAWLRFLLLRILIALGLPAQPKFV